MLTTRIHFPTIDSTNSWAKRNVNLFEQDHLTLVTADAQTAGRGRFKRKWESSSCQNIYASFCFFLGKEETGTGNILQVLAISAVEVLTQLGFSPRLKWPNDILLSDKKVAGLLCETTTFFETLFVVLGIGININMPKQALSQIDRPATSLFAESGKHFNLEAIIQLLHKQFSVNLITFFDKGFTPFLPKYQNKIATTIYQKIYFHGNNKIWEGFFHSIGSNGSLNLILTSGEIKNFIAGEIL